MNFHWYIYALICSVLFWGVVPEGPEWQRWCAAFLAYATALCIAKAAGLFK